MQQDFDEINEVINNDNEGKKLASPIDLNLAKMKILNLPLLTWCNYETKPRKMKITNTGKTVVLSVMWPNDNAYIFSGPFKDNYEFSQIHFHWGKNEMIGSEHSFDGARHAMELHAVHFNSKYKNKSNAINEPDGTVIIVYVFKLQLTTNDNLNTIIKSLNLIQEPDSSVRIDPEPITNILRPFNDDYFLYKGTLNINNYEREIIWVVSRVPIGISIEQVSQFRNIYNRNLDKIINNCRDIDDDSDNNQQIFHICPSGYSYWSLLQLPSGPVTDSQKINQQNNLYN